MAKRQELRELDCSKLKLTKNECKFIQAVNQNCYKNNTKLCLVNKKLLYIQDERVNVAGYFQEQPPILKVAIKNSTEEWLPILVHEYCHLLQYVNDTTAWHTCCNTRYGDAVSIVVEWLTTGKIKDPKGINRYIKLNRNMELECEKMSVKIIKQYCLDIDLDNYIKNANAYIYLYTWLKTSKQWYKKPPYRSTKILNEMPITFCKNYGKMSKKLLDLYNKHCL